MLSPDEDATRELRKARFNRGAQLRRRVAAAQVMQHDRLVPGERLAMLDQIVQVQVAKGGPLGALLFAQKRALDHQDAAARQAWRELPDSGAGVAAVGEPDLLAFRFHARARRAQRRDLGRRAADELRPQFSAPPKQVQSEAGHDMVGRESLQREVAGELDPAAGIERYELPAVVDALETSRRRDQRREIAGYRARAKDARRPLMMERALRKQVRNPERVVEVAVGEEEVAGAGELGGAAAGVERQARRIDAEPGLLAGEREAFDRQLTAAEVARRATGRAWGRGQISW